MSASLPRLKTIQQLNRNNTLNQSQHGLKFRKLTLNPPENGEDSKQSLKVINTQRLKSLERYSTPQEQREYKNEKIHLNLIEKKLLKGTYDQKKETGSELNILKQKRDHIKVETTFKQRQMQRLKHQLQDVKQGISELLARKGEADHKLNETRTKVQSQLATTEATRETQLILQHMANLRQEINLNLSKRHNQLRHHLTYCHNTITLFDNELREITEKCASREAKLDDLRKMMTKERQERNDIMAKHQEKIGKRKEGDLIQLQKSKVYLTLLDEADMQSHRKGFNSIFHKILANVFIARYCKGHMNQLRERYENSEQSYLSLCSYHSFNSDQPQGLVTRFFQHTTQSTQIYHLIKQKEHYIETLEAKNIALKNQFLKIESQMLQQSSISKPISNGLSNNKPSEIASLQTQIEEIEQKTTDIKSNILRMLKVLNQKGEKRVQSGYQPTLNNLVNLSNITLQLINSHQ